METTAEQQKQQQQPNGNGQSDSNPHQGAALAKAPSGTEHVAIGDGSALSPFSAQSVAGFELAQRMGQALAASSIVPDNFRGKVANCMIAMEYAARLQVSVMAVMQNLGIIQGKPALSSQFLIGSVNSSGRFTPLRFEWSGKPGTDEWACRAVAKDRASGEVLEGEWVTWLMAKKEGWVQRKGSKWLTMPGQMFRYRAAAFWTRVYCPEIVLGFRTVDELEDMVGVDAPDTVDMPNELSPASAQSLEAVLGLQRNAAEVVDAEPAEPTPEQKAEPKPQPAQQTLDAGSGKKGK